MTETSNNPTVETSEDTLRNTTLETLVGRMRADHERKLDFIAPANALRMVNGRLLVPNAHQHISLAGVTTSDLRVNLRPSAVSQLATRLDLPSRYCRKLHALAVEYNLGNRDLASTAAMYDDTVNHWLVRSTKKMMIRAFQPNEAGFAAGRAVLSDQYLTLDNLDVLMATLDGLASTGIDAEVVSADLSPDKMRVRVKSEQIAAYAPELLKGYRSPFTGATGDENPTVFAGFELSNSEVGSGAAVITPRLEVEICSNGMRITKDVYSRTHLGSRQPEGLINWSDESRVASVALVRSETADAVRTFMNIDYVKQHLAEITEKSGAPIDSPMRTIESVGKRLSWSEDEQDAIMAKFVSGGVSTSGGLMHAVTAAAQAIVDPDRAAMLEESGMEALSLIG